MKPLPESCLGWRGKLLVSCQAAEGDAFRDAGALARFARAAVQGGAVGIRAAGAEDVRAIRAAVDVPIIGIEKSLVDDGRILITPTLEAARELVKAGAALIALDCTARGQRYGALERLQHIQRELRVPVLADIATVEEARAAEAAGADFVLSTMRGYTDDTAHAREFDAAFIAELTRAVTVPVIAEGRIWTPEQARAAVVAGAFAVVIGSAITRPQEITRRFASAIAAATPALDQYFIGIDLGGTNIKSGVVSQRGELLFSAVTPTPAQAGREALLQRVKDIVSDCLGEARARNLAPAALGVATAGWVDAVTGEVVYASDNLPGWTGTPLGAVLQAAFGLPVAVENDANAMAIGERYFGAARGVDDFLCITLGTGVGCGVYAGGQLQRGAHALANALGHVPLERDGLPCTCGKRGCLEVYANAAALVRYAGGGSAPEIISAAHQGDAPARQALRTYAEHLVRGCVPALHLLDPALLVLGGGVTENNSLLLAEVEAELARQLLQPAQRRLAVRAAQLGYFGGVIGAAAAALEFTRQ